MLTFENLVSNREKLLSYVAENYLLSVTIFCLIYITATALSLPGATVMTLTGALLFSYTAIIYTVVSATVGATAAFLASRYIAGNWVQTKYADKLERFNTEFETNGIYYILTLRLIPLFPFFLINIFAGLTKVRTFTFFWTTLIGILPGGFVYVFAGRELSHINSPSDIFSIKVMTAFVLFGILTIIPVVYKKIKAKV